MDGEQVVGSGEQETAQDNVAEGVEQTAGQQTVGEVAPTIDPQEYERIKTEHGTLVQNWQKLESIANKDEIFRKELERAWKGLPPAQQAQIAKAQTNQSRGNQSNQEIAEIKQQLKEFRDAQQQQQQELLKREKFAEVQNDTEQTFKKFEATPEDQAEFWKRYGSMIRRETQELMTKGVPPQQASKMAEFRHSFNIAGEYAMLMDDKLGDLYTKKAAQRNSPLRGISSPADKAQTNGVMPSVKERFLSAIKNEKSAEKRAEMYAAFGKEYGEPEGGFFKSNKGW